MKGKESKFYISEILQNITIIFLCFMFYLKQSKAEDIKVLDHKNYNHNLQIINGTNNKIIYEFKSKIVVNKEDQELGLMWVNFLPRNYAMLFDFGQERIINMWMKNTKIPLDIIFINKNNEINHIHHNAKPESLNIISSESKSKMVLEINGGLAQELGIKIGDIIVVKILNKLVS